MKSTLSHVYFYVPNVEKTYKFYEKLLAYLGYKEEIKQSWGFAFSNDGTGIWFVKTPKSHVKDGYHRKRTGLNHLAFHVESKKDVDKFCKEFLEKNKIKTLYGSPKAFPEYTKDYYAVYFEDPDRIKLEVTFH